MKKRTIIIMITAFLVSTLSIAQNYQPTCVENSSSWRFFIVGLDEIYDNTLSVKNKNGDYYELDLLSMNGMNEPLGEVRENLETGEVWYRYNASYPEKLIMDLSLEVGEQFEFPTPSGYGTGEVMRVWLDSENRKHIKFNTLTDAFNDSIEFIEGVGPNVGIIYSEIQRGMISCKFENEELVYQNPSTSFINCELNTTQVLAANTQRTTIYPNPATDQITLELEDQQYVQIQLFSLAGVLLYNETILCRQKTISIKDLEYGVYFLKINDLKNNNFQQHKIIKL